VGRDRNKEGRGRWHLDRPAYPTNLTPVPGAGRALATYVCPWCSLSLQSSVLPYIVGRTPVEIQAILTGHIELHIRTNHPGMPVEVIVYPPALTLEPAGRDM
jgi:hypothetical protein